MSAAYALVGRTAETQPLLDQMLEGVATGRRMLLHARVLTELSEACLLVGRLDEALAVAMRGLEFCRTHAHQGEQAWTLRLLGEIHAYRQPPQAELAEVSYRETLALVEALGMRPLVAHCYRGLGTLYVKTDQAEQAHAELSKAIEMYQAMEMTFWRPETEASLA